PRVRGFKSHPLRQQQRRLPAREAGLLGLDERSARSRPEAVPRFVPRYLTRIEAVGVDGAGGSASVLRQRERWGTPAIALQGVGGVRTVSRLRGSPLGRVTLLREPDQNPQAVSRKMAIAGSRSGALLRGRGRAGGFGAQ